MQIIHNIVLFVLIIHNVSPLKNKSENMTKKLARFHLYRYQLLPTNRYFQGDMYGASSVEELIAKKNDFFQEALNSDGVFKTNRTNTTTQKLFERDDFILYLVAANRAINRETKDFKTEVIENWPKILVAVWNKPDKQLIAVQHRSAAFKSTDAVIKLIFSSIERILSQRQLTAVSDPLFEKHVFWNLINENIGKVQQIEFEIITPNMANISGTLPENLKEFARQTNSVKSKIVINSDPSTSLRVDENNPTINGLVDYSSEGGGDITLKINGYSKKIHTSRTVKEIAIDETCLIGEPEAVAKILKELLS